MRLILPLFLLLSSIANAEDRFANVEIKTLPVTDNIYMLMGSGGNIGVSNGEDGMLMIDDQYEPLAARIKAALQEINDEAPTFLLNTHYHGDHTGGNVEFGHDSIIVAHQNVRIRLINGDTQGNFPKHALPDITYAQAATIHFNGEDIALIHTGPSHTDGDTMVHFPKANVLHMGDNFFNKLFPYVDVKGGGSVEGLKATLKIVLDLVDDETKIIPGHGALANKQDLAQKLQMIEETSASVKASIASGKSLEEIIAAGVAEPWKSWTWGFINETRWLTTLYNSYK